MMVWDYAREQAVPESEMIPNGDTWKASERAKYEQVKLTSQLLRESLCS